MVGDLSAQLSSEIRSDSKLLELQALGSAIEEPGGWAKVAT